MIGADTTFLVQLEIAEHPQHAAAQATLRREVIDSTQPLVLAPQVLAEFVHVVTDPRRFANPLSIDRALDQAAFWWNATEVRHVFPTSDSTRTFLEWMRAHRLGRKRLLDTQLAATLWTSGVRRIATANPADFAVFGVFEFV
ncbi:MAG: PIN domain-containing protein [Tepidisphaeraceae bacterium]